MRRTITAAAIAVILAAFLGGCGGDPERPPEKQADPVYQPLVTPTAVLNNLQLAYNRRDIASYDKFLDESFVFYFRDTDVGGPIPEQWGRADEVTVTTRLFDPSYSGAYRCKQIKMNVAFEDGVNWAAFEPSAFPGETWLRATLFYSFSIDVEPDTTFQPAAGAKAEFVVRNVGTDEAPQWRLVELHDRGASVLRAVWAAGVEESTWGGVKALYR